MSSVKPSMTLAEVTNLLATYFSEPIQAVAPLGTGHIARVFSFQAGGQDYVVRFIGDTMAGTFKKEMAIAEMLSTSNVPLPPILHEGTLGDYHFAITPRAAGQPLNELTATAQQQILPQLIANLDAIHQVDVSGTAGYGFFDETAVGQLLVGHSPSWQAHLLSVMEEDENDFFGLWHRLFEESFLERPLFDQLYAEMQTLFPYLPHDRYLVHGDYGFNNVLAKDGEITAVLDWQNAMFGDFVYDIAWLDFFAPQIGYFAHFQRHYHDQDRSVPNFAERMRCYQCRIALDGLRFYAKMEQRAAYEWTKQRMAAVLKQGDFD